MTPQQWLEVKRLFALSRPLSPSERKSLLEADLEPEVRREVERLLRSDDALPPGFLPSGQSSPDDFVNPRTDDLADPRLGQLLKQRYRLERLMGRGGASVVYLASDILMPPRRVVVKMLQGGKSENQWLRRKFAQESEALARIHHPNVVSVVDTGPSPDGGYLVMERLDGHTLRAALAQGPMDLSRLANIFRGLGEGVEAAHSRGVLHRDLKPENIMLLDAGHTELAKLIDFGIAKLEDPQDAEATETVVLAGTTAYMAPEQLMGRASTASDVYALGVIAYEAVTGVRPFYPATPVQLYQMQKKGGIAHPASLRPGLAPEAGDWVLKALRFRSDSRPSSARLFCQELAASLLAPPRPRVFTRRRAVAAAVSAGAAALGSGIVLARRAPAEESVTLTYLGGESFGGWILHNDLNDSVEYNSAHSGYDITRFRSRTGGYYFRRLSGAQNLAARRRGWKLTLQGLAVRGYLGTEIELESPGRRFDLGVYANSAGGQTVILSTKVGQEVLGLTYELTEPLQPWPIYTLIGEPDAREARLLVNGVERISSYRGHQNWLEHRGFVFGASSLFDPTGEGEALVKVVHFETGVR
ncbi:MAG TPA: serine/threonine-protein kinase [Candidatus Acidoferrales bacterium]|nr:serine/threonine-protein kinase [Candidatus Acidoferrales bacterium]